MGRPPNIPDSVVIKLRKQVAAGESVSAAARSLGITRSNASMLVNGHSRPHVGGPLAGPFVVLCPFCGSEGEEAPDGSPGECKCGGSYIDLRRWPSMSVVQVARLLDAHPAWVLALEAQEEWVTVRLEKRRIPQKVSPPHNNSSDSVIGVDCG